MAWRPETKVAKQGIEEDVLKGLLIDVESSYGGAGSGRIK
jgi:hypothetical protein